MAAAAVDMAAAVLAAVLVVAVVVAVVLYLMVEIAVPELVAGKIAATAELLLMQALMMLVVLAAAGEELLLRVKVEIVTADMAAQRAKSAFTAQHLQVAGLPCATHLDQL
jgi:hypothetical protein